MRIDARMFWRLTWREYDILVERLEAKREREVDEPVQRMLHLMANAWYSKKFEYSEFARGGPYANLTEEELRAIGLQQMKDLVVMLGGEVNI